MPKSKQRPIKVLVRPFYRFFLVDLLVDREARPVMIYSGVLIVFGALIFHHVEKWGWLDSIYFTVVTITTIGFGDLTPQTSLGKIVTIFYGLNGIALLLMLFDQIRRIRSLEYRQARKAISELNQEHAQAEPS